MKQLLVVLVIVFLLLGACSAPTTNVPTQTPSTTPVSKAQEIFQQWEKEGKVLEIEPGRYRLAMVVKFAPHLNSEHPESLKIPVPPPSANWDCDDDALYMYNYLIKGGFEEKEVTIIIGDLDVEYEDLLKLQFDHVWVLVNIKLGVKVPCDKTYPGVTICAEDGYYLAYDWGKPCSDEQHYEGCPITYEELLRAVEYDKKQK